MRRQRECCWPDGCNKLARRALGDGRYCLRHHRLNEGQANRAADPAPAVPRQRRLPRAQPAMLACLVIDDWDDAATVTLHLGAMDVRCELCGSWNFAAERPSICCHNGKCSHLPDFPDAPELLQRLLLGRDRRSRRFRMCLRRYNAALSFVSFGAKIQTLVGNPGNPAPPVCVVHGAVYHHSHPLFPQEDAPAKHAQLYLFDSAQATRVRADRDEFLDATLLSELVAMLEACANPYIRAYRRMGELAQDTAFGVGLHMYSVSSHFRDIPAACVSSAQEIGDSVAWPQLASQRAVYVVLFTTFRMFRCQNSSLASQLPRTATCAVIMPRREMNWPSSSSRRMVLRPDLAI